MSYHPSDPTSTVELPHMPTVVSSLGGANNNTITIQITPATTGGTPTNFVIWKFVASGSISELTTIEAAGDGATEYVYELTPADSGGVMITAKAQNSAGESDFGNYSGLGYTSYTPIPGETEESPTETVELPDAPTVVLSSGGDNNNTITVQITPAETGGTATNFVIYKRIYDVGGSPAFVANVNPGDPDYAYEMVEGDENISLVAKAQNSAGDSGYSSDLMSNDGDFFSYTPIELPLAPVVNASLGGENNNTVTLQISAYPNDEGTGVLGGIPTHFFIKKDSGGGVGTQTEIAEVARSLYDGPLDSVSYVYQLVEGDENILLWVGSRNSDGDSIGTTGNSIHPFSYTGSSEAVTIEVRYKVNEGDTFTGITGPSVSPGMGLGFKSRSAGGNSRLELNLGDTYTFADPDGPAEASGGFGHHFGSDIPGVTWQYYPGAGKLEFRTTQDNFDSPIVGPAEGVLISFNLVVPDGMTADEVRNDLEIHLEDHHTLSLDPANGFGPLGDSSNGGADSYRVFVRGYTTEYYDTVSGDHFRIPFAGATFTDPPATTRYGWKTTGDGRMPRWVKGDEPLTLRIGASTFLGCMDPDACNYDPEMMFSDDGVNRCQYSVEFANNPVGHLPVPDGGFIDINLNDHIASDPNNPTRDVGASSNFIGAGLLDRIGTPYEVPIYNIVSQPSHGYLTSLGGGQYRYTPNAELPEGDVNDSFTWVITLDAGDGCASEECLVNLSLKAIIEEGTGDDQGTGSIDIGAPSEGEDTSDSVSTGDSGIVSDPGDQESVGSGFTATFGDYNTRTASLHNLAEIDPASGDLVSFGENVVVFGSVAAVLGRVPGPDPYDSALIYIFESQQNSPIWSLVNTISLSGVITTTTTVSNKPPTQIKMSDNIIIFGGMDVSAFGGGMDSVVYIIEKDTITGTWSQTASIRNTSGEGFGKAIDIYQDTIIIGAPQVDSTTEGSDGEAYVITKQPDGSWPDSAQNSVPGVQVLKASDSSGGYGFGTSVAINNNLIAVGAPSAFGGSGTPRGGTVYLFEKDGSTWGVHAGDYFDGGSWFNESGKIYAYRYDLVTMGPVEEMYPVADDTPSDYFGTNVALDKNASANESYIAVSSPGFFSEDEDGNLLDVGAVYVYRIDEMLDGYVLSQRILSPDPDGDGFFGKSIDISGDMLAIGDSFNSGKVYVFERNGTGYEQWLPTIDGFSSMTGYSNINHGLGKNISIDGSLGLVAFGSRAHEAFITMASEYWEADSSSSSGGAFVNPGYGQGSEQNDSGSGSQQDNSNSGGGNQYVPPTSFTPTPNTPCSEGGAGPECGLGRIYDETQTSEVGPSFNTHPQLAAGPDGTLINVDTVSCLYMPASWQTANESQKIIDEVISHMSSISSDRTLFQKDDGTDPGDKEFALYKKTMRQTLNGIAYRHAFTLRTIDGYNLKWPEAFKTTIMKTEFDDSDPDYPRISKHGKVALQEMYASVDNTSRYCGPPASIQLTSLSPTYNSGIPGLQAGITMYIPTDYNGNTSAATVENTRVMWRLSRLTDNNWGIGQDFSSNPSTWLLAANAQIANPGAAGWVSTGTGNNPLGWPSQTYTTTISIDLTADALGNSAGAAEYSDLMDIQMAISPASIRYGMQCMLVDASGDAWEENDVETSLVTSPEEFGLLDYPTIEKLNILPEATITNARMSVEGYYPLYATEAEANADPDGNGTSHLHTLSGVGYYMPNGLPGGIGGGIQYHGDYPGDDGVISIQSWDIGSQLPVGASVLAYWGSTPSIPDENKLSSSDPTLFTWGLTGASSATIANNPSAEQAGQLITFTDMDSDETLSVTATIFPDSQFESTFTLPIDLRTVIAASVNAVAIAPESGTWDPSIVTFGALSKDEISGNWIVQSDASATSDNMTVQFAIGAKYDNQATDSEETWSYRVKDSITDTWTSFTQISGASATIDIEVPVNSPDRIYEIDILHSSSDKDLNPSSDDAAFEDLSDIGGGVLGWRERLEVIVSNIVPLSLSFDSDSITNFVEALNNELETETYTHYIVDPETNPTLAQSLGSDLVNYTMDQLAIDDGGLYEYTHRGLSIDQIVGTHAFQDTSWEPFDHTVSATGGIPQSVAIYNDQVPSETMLSLDSPGSWSSGSPLSVSLIDENGVDQTSAMLTTFNGVEGANEIRIARFSYIASANTGGASIDTSSPDSFANAIKNHLPTQGSYTKQVIATLDTSMVAAFSEMDSGGNPIHETYTESDEENFQLEIYAERRLTGLWLSQNPSSHYGDSDYNSPFDMYQANEHSISIGSPDPSDTLTANGNITAVSMESFTAPTANGWTEGNHPRFNITTHPNVSNSNPFTITVNTWANYDNEVYNPDWAVMDYPTSGFYWSSADNPNTENFEYVIFGDVNHILTINGSAAGTPIAAGPGTGAGFSQYPETDGLFAGQIPAGQQLEIELSADAPHDAALYVKLSAPDAVLGTFSGDAPDGQIEFSIVVQKECVDDTLFEQAFETQNGMPSFSIPQNTVVLCSCINTSDIDGDSVAMGQPDEVVSFGPINLVSNSMTNPIQVGYLESNGSYGWNSSWLQLDNVDYTNAESVVETSNDCWDVDFSSGLWAASSARIGLGDNQGIDTTGQPLQTVGDYQSTDAWMWFENESDGTYLKFRNFQGTAGEQIVLTFTPKYSFCENSTEEVFSSFSITIQIEDCEESVCDCTGIEPQTDYFLISKSNWDAIEALPNPTYEGDFVGAQMINWVVDRSQVIDRQQLLASLNENDPWPVISKWTNTNGNGASVTYSSSIHGNIPELYEGEVLYHHENVDYYILCGVRSGYNDNGCELVRLQLPQFNLYSNGTLTESPSADPGYSGIFYKLGNDWASNTSWGGAGANPDFITPSQDNYDGVWDVNTAPNPRPDIIDYKQVYTICCPPEGFWSAPEDCCFKVANVQNSWSGMDTAAYDLNDPSTHQYTGNIGWPVAWGDPDIPVTATVNDAVYHWNTLGDNPYDFGKFLDGSSTTIDGNSYYPRVDLKNDVFYRYPGYEGIGSSVDANVLNDFIENDWNSPGTSGEILFCVVYLTAAGKEYYHSPDVGNQGGPEGWWTHEEYDINDVSDCLPVALKIWPNNGANYYWNSRPDAPMFFPIETSNISPGDIILGHTWTEADLDFISGHAVYNGSLYNANSPEGTGFLNAYFDFGSVSAPNSSWYFDYGAMQDEPWFKICCPYDMYVLPPTDGIPVIGGGDFGGIVSPGTPGFATSDKDLKKNIAIVPNPVATNYHLLGLYTIEFDWSQTATDLFGMTGHVKEGFIAEQLEQLYPAPDPKNPPTSKKDGHIWWYEYMTDEQKAMSSGVHNYYTFVNSEMLEAKIQEAIEASES